MRSNAFMRGTLAAAALTTLLLGACSDDPVAPSSSFATRGVVVQLKGSDTVVLDGTTRTGRLQLKEGTTLDSLSLTFILNDGTRGLPDGTDYTVDYTVADPAVASIEKVGQWGFKVNGLGAGSTSFTVALKKGTQVIYTSTQLPIEVEAVAKGLNAGDTLSYRFYDRDSTDARTGEAQSRKWIVLRSDLTIHGRSNVSEVLQIRYDALTMEEGRDTIYISLDENGGVYEYNLLRRLLLRLNNGEAFASRVPELWVKVSDIGTGVTTWPSIVGQDSVEVKNVTLEGLPFTVDVIFRGMASHRGIVATTVPMGSFPDARHTDHTFFVRIKAAGAIPLELMYDSVRAGYDVSSQVGILRATLQGKLLTAGAGGQTETSPVHGYDMELLGVVRKD